MRGKSNFYKHLIRVFWLSLVIGTVGIWYYVDKSIPDGKNVHFPFHGGLLYTAKARKWHWEMKAISRRIVSP